MAGAGIRVITSWLVNGRQRMDPLITTQQTPARFTVYCIDNTADFFAE
jgi:hypothetical protein